MSNWKEILKNKEGPQTKREVLEEHENREKDSAKITELYGRNANPLVSKPKWSGALSSLNDLRSAFRTHHANLPQALTKTKKIIFKLRISATTSGSTKSNKVISIHVNRFAYTDEGDNTGVHLTPSDSGSTSKYNFILDFVEIFNKPNHTYKNIEAKLSYRSTQAVKNLGITLQDIISFVLNEDEKWKFSINDNNHLKIDYHDYEMLKRLKGIQLNPKSTYREF